MIAALVAVAFGFVAWTLAEYLIHRFVMHRYFRDRHWRHHLRPSAKEGLLTYTEAAIGAAVALLCLIATFGLTIGGAAWFGLLLGYCTYLLVHHALHNWKITPGSLLRPLYERHVIHHGGVEANFGIVSGFWDRVFGTEARP
jgi:sterol desaturase/sphingolipid hydroxylase (fatty acid hydroxylase superfamily)